MYDVNYQKCMNRWFIIAGSSSYVGGIALWYLNTSHTCMHSVKEHLKFSPVVYVICNNLFQNQGRLCFSPSNIFLLFKTKLAHSACERVYQYFEYMLAEMWNITFHRKWCHSFANAFQGLLIVFSLGCMSWLRRIA